MLPEPLHPLLRRAIRFGGLALAVAVGAMLVQGVVGIGSPAVANAFGSWVFAGIIVVSAVGCVARAVLVRAGRLAWSVLAGGLVLYAIGSVIWSFWLQYREEPPYPSICDPLWLALYPAAYVSVALLIRGRVARFAGGGWLDGVVAALGAAAVGVAVIYDAVAAGATGSTAAIATNFAYPFLDMLLIGLTLGVFAFTGWRPDRALLVLGGGFMLLGAADSVYVLQVADGTYLPGGLANALWVAGIAALALAAWLRPRTDLTARPDGRAVLLVPGTFTLSSLGLLIFDHFHPVNGLTVGLATGALLAAVARMALTFHDIRALANARHEARTDELTGLPNRRLFFRRLADAIVPGEPLAVLIIDLDHFKELNDTLGHRAGDMLLQAVGPRLQEALRPGDLLARLGGDEFALLLHGAGEDAAATVADRIAAVVAQPFEVAGLRVSIGSSVGIALFPDHATDPEGLVQRADVAMYEAKRASCRHTIYSPQRDTHSRDRLALMGELSQAIGAGQLVLHYQPVCDAASGAITGAEALVRWDHPERGLLAPGEFLPLAEQAGLMRPLTLSVLDQALGECRRWQLQGLGLTVAVNLGAANVLDTQLPGDIGALLDRWSLEPAAVILEISEGTLMVDADRVLDVLARLSESGMGLALDDFGAGYASLSYLKRLPVDELKIDRSFVRALVDDADDAAIVRSTIELAHNLRLRVVVEGVEDGAALDLLRGWDCDLVQGFHICRPLPADAFADWALARSAGVRPR